jgi:hypothetical protein
MACTCRNGGHPAQVASLGVPRDTGRIMSGSDGFQVDLDELNTLASTSIPFIETTCNNAGSTLKANSRNDSAIFEDSSASTLYMGAETAFTETRADLENLLDALSSSLEECAKALREIHRRYSGAEDQNLTRANAISAQLS